MTFRIVLIAINAVLLSLVVACIAWGVPMWPPAILLTITLIALLFERARYRGGSDSAPGDGWVETDERFKDPETGDLLQVWYEPSSGRRRYVPLTIRPEG
jgi:hypothetical protein